MADDKSGREEQARNADDRQHERDITAALERGDETEPPIDDAELDAFEGDIEDLSFPATGADIVAAVGDRELTAEDETYRVAALVPESETFESPDDVRVRVQRPTIAAAMRRIVAASESAKTDGLRGSQREAYEKTLRALKHLDADDDDEGIQQITDWIVERIDENDTFPGSRAVRRQAAKFCRAKGYQIRNDEWLGV